ncbi:DEAD/DEAH box helicase family protein [Ruminococcus sp.]|uniref:DEAD/DEAH box helicase family protein n=1 Tax=Ruminococcus sp. TaxID=41978 RepID=UPI003890BB3A
MYDYLTDYIVDYYEEQDGEPIEVPEDGIDPVLLQRLERGLYDIDTMNQMLSFFSESYYRRDNDDEINAVYDKVIDALQHRINDPVMSNDKYVRGDTRLDVFDEDAERMKYPFFGVDEVVNEIFATTPYLGASLEEIRAYIEGVSDPQRRMEYIRSIFNNDFTELILADETRAGYKTYDNGLLIWKGRYPSREGQRFLRWDAVAGHFDAMRKLGMLRSDIKSLLSQDGQLQYLADAAGANAPAFVFSQEIIDNVLTRGSNVVQSKMRIYEQFQKSLSRDENIRFLKREYGIGGGSSAVAYTGISEMHDGKGITLSIGFDPDRPHQLLKWNYVEKRIRELISLDRYLNDKDKSEYPSWLERTEQHRIEVAEENQRREEERRRKMEMEISPEERLLNEGVQHTYEYQYHLGDTVYIGASTYELLSIVDDRVMLFDPKFPLINTEMPRDEFDAKVQENPLNNHLRILVEQKDELKDAVPSEESRSFSDKLWDDYRQAQEANPDRIVLYRVGDFMEIMGDDVPKIAQELDITPTQRVLSDGRRIPMCGFPRDHTQALSDMLMDRGYDLVLCTDENGEFKTIRLNSDSKGEPRQSRVIARVEYLDHDGNVYDNQEYTSEYHFKMDIQEESDFTDGLKVYLYADKDGNVGEYPFLNISVIKSIEIVDFAPFANEHDMMIDRAKELINEFCQREYHHSADFDDLSNVSLAYTETEDGMHEIQSYADLESFRIVTTVDGQIVRTEDFESLQDMVNQGLQGLEFGDLVYVSEDELAPFYEPDEDIANVVHTAYSEPPTDDIEDDELSEVDPDKIRASLAESGIVNGEVVDPEKLNANPFIQQVMADVEAATQEQPEEEIKLRSVVIDLRPDNMIVADYIGRTIRIDDRDFKIEDVSDRGEVSLRDLTFERDNGYPIFRNENAGFVRRILAEQSKQNQQDNPNNEIVPAWERQPRAKAQTFDLHPDIPMADRHTFDLKSFFVEEVGKKARFRRNIEAIRVLKECEFDNRFASPDEQQILAQYVGWGGIPEAFDENNAAWADEFTELYGLLSPEEYTSARASTLTAFFTPPVVISAVYKVMENMGFQRGNILEPSCGIGNFIGMLPDSMSESRVFGVEIDTISAAIAQQLYQRSSIAAQPFEKAEIPDSFFDAVVGNVPFGDDRISDKRYDKHHFLIHDYFFAKSLDKLRPGGVMALVTSRGTMDKENPAVRKYIAQRADLLGAIRLPNNTFRGNAGTDVVSDILILQKRDRIIDIEPSWVHLNTDDNGITMNSYYVEHPEMILGEMKMVSGRFGMTPDCIPYEGADLGELLNEAVSNIHGEVTEYEVVEDMEEDLSIPADPSVRNFSFTLVDGQIYFRENSRMIPFDVSATAQNRIKGMIPIRDSVRRLLEMQTENYPDAEIQAEQERLNTLYDNYTKKYGLINSRANNSAFSMDSSYSLISSLEILDEDGNLERKADIFTKRTIRAHEPVTSVDTASEALAVSMAERACVDMDFMSKLSGLSEEKLYEELKGVIFLNPMHGYGNSYEAKYLTSDEYLSGNVREKLKWTRRSAEVNPNDYSVNVEALERVQPEDLKASEISVRLGATWLPVEDVQKFIYQLLDTPHYARWRIKVHYSPITGEWNIENKTYDRTNVKAYSTYGTDRINAYQIIEQTLNLKDARIYDYIEEPDGRKKAVLNKKETAIALAKQDQIKQQFQEWIWSDPSRRERLCRLYNDKFNNIRPREYDGSHITFVGMNPEIELREHQRNAVAHIIYGGNTLLAHEVGAGKTFAMTAAAMESKRLGLCNKSLFVVPNHLTEQWAAEFLQLYPAANILVATKKDFERKNRRRFCGRIATGDYDAVIIGHSQFEKIPISIERQISMLQAQLNEITDAIYELSQKRDDKFTVKQLEKTRKSIKNKLEKLNSQDRKDDVVTFEELGVDRLFVDESHYYKNLYLYTKMRNVGGIAQTEAAKSSDLFMKCRYLDELTGSRGTVFATGTPISNSMVELYTIQRYLQYDALVRNDLQYFDAWASTFGETITAVELTPEGTGYRAKTRFAKFYNLPELMAMFREVADIQTADMLNLPVPESNFHNIAVKPSEMQKEMVAALGERAEKIRGGRVDASVDNMLNITNDGRKLALDQRLLNPMLEDYDGSKVNACVDNVYRIWDETADDRSSQLVFCDLSTPKSEDEFSVYTDIRKKLIERGIPEDQIRFIHEAKTEAQKLDLFRKVRKGEVRILLGSTAKMGAGTNVQNKLIASHDLDCPWRPSDLQQRAGRIIRQGNENPKVHIYRYVTEETFDAYLYQLVEAKQKFCAQIMTSKTPVRSAEDVDQTALSYAEIKMLATGNPHIKEKMDLDIQVQKLQMIKAGFLSNKYDLEDKLLKYYPEQIAFYTGVIDGLKQDLEVAKKHPKSTDDGFVGMEIQGVLFDDKAKAGQAILDACKAMKSSDAFHLGSYRGFNMDMYFDTVGRQYGIRLKGRLSHDVKLSTDIHGNITRLDNALDGIEKRLERTIADLEDTQKQFNTAKIEVQKPFPQEEELRTKTARLNELNALLDVDKHDNELFGSEQSDVGDNTPDRCRSSREERS